MRPERHPARSLAGLGDRHARAAQEVHHEPISQHQPGRNVKQKDRRKPDQHPRPWIQDEVRSHHPGNRSARAHQWRPRAWIHHDVRDRRRHSADQVEHQIRGSVPGSPPRCPRKSTETTCFPPRARMTRHAGTSTSAAAGSPSPMPACECPVSTTSSWRGTTPNSDDKSFNARGRTDNSQKKTVMFTAIRK